MNYLLTPLQLILIIPLLRLGELLVNAPRFRHTRVCSGNTITRAINAMQVLTTPSCTRLPPPVVAFARYHLLEPAPRHLSSGKAEPRVDFASSDT